jgi:hypothetical protein
MTDRASLKRKLESLQQEERAVRDALQKYEAVLQRYQTVLNHQTTLEMQTFLMQRCARIAEFSEITPTTCKFDNGLIAYVNVDSRELDLYDGVEIIIFGDYNGIRVSSRAFNSWTTAGKRLALVADIFPAIEHVVRFVLPAWQKAREELDMGSLMTARVLRWISKQVGGQWPDIITGNFPLK